MAIPSYVRTIWANLTSPAINATNLNKIENGIYDVTEQSNATTNTVVELGSPASIPFVPQPDPIAYQEGTLWYDDNRKALAYFDDVTNDPIHIGQEMLIHVYNDTGVTIPKGSFVSYSGAVVGDFPAVVLAQANSVNTSSVQGMVSKNMLTGTSGSIVVQGVVSGIDTTGYIVGEQLYLSDTVAGGATNIAPDIVSTVGGAINSEAEGDFYVKINNFIRLPYAMATLNGGSSGATITTAWSDITNYTSRESIIMTANEVTGEIAVTQAGVYTAYINIVVTFDDIGATSEFLYARMVGDNGYVGVNMPFSIARNGEGASLYPSFTGTIPAENYKLQVSSSVDLTNVVYSFTGMTLEAKKLSF